MHRHLEEGIQTYTSASEKKNFLLKKYKQRSPCQSGLLIRDTFFTRQNAHCHEISYSKKVELIFLVTSYSKSFS